MVVGGAAGKSRAQGRPADDGRDDRAGARGVGAVLPVLPRERQLPRAHLRLRRAPRHREGAQGDGLRARRGARRRCSIGCAKSKARARDAWLEGHDAEAPDAVHSDSSRWRRCSHERRTLDSRHRAATTSRRAKGGRCRSAAASLRSSTSAIASSPPTTSARTRAGRCATASSPARRSCARCTPGRSTSRPAASSGRPAARISASTTYPTRVEDGVVVVGLPALPRQTSGAGTFRIVRLRTDYYTNVVPHPLVRTSRRVYLRNPGGPAFEPCMTTNRRPTST